MSDPDALSLDDHLTIGRAALAEIAALGEIPQEALSICFHFASPNDAEADRWGDDAQCIQNSRSIFEVMPFDLAVDYVGGQVGIEAWERVRPNEDWLEDRLPRMLDTAERAGMVFLGWSFEPRGFPYVSACPTVNVLDANTSAGRSKIDQMIRELGEAREGKGQ